MLHFLRTYQRILFLILTVIIVISFVFFGTYGTFMNAPSDEEAVVFKTADGQAVTRGSFERLKRFLIFDADVIPSATAFPNYLNAGFLQKELVQTGALEEIALKNWQSVGSELEAKLVQEKSWRPFTHSENESISSLNVWQIFAPAIPENLVKLKNAQEPQEVLKAHFALMKAEKNFPEPYLAQILSWQENKQKGLTSEVEQQRGCLSLFGYKDSLDWLGHKLYETTIYAILELAAKAKKEGLTVSDQEIERHLKSVLEASLQKARVLQLSFLHLDNIDAFYQQQLHLLHLSDEELQAIYRPLLLVQKLICQEQKALLEKTGNLIEKTALERAPVTIYEMDPSLHFTKADDLYLFESYLEKVAVSPHSLELAPVDVVKKRAPELVAQTFQVEIREITPEDVSLKDVWAFELQDDGWKKIQARFPELGFAKNADEREALLDSLSPSLRKNIDSYVKRELFTQRKELADVLLEGAKTSLQYVTLQGKATADTPFKGLKDASPLEARLAAGESIKKISFDGETYYRLIPLKAEEPVILSFAEAKKVLAKPAPKKYTGLVNSLVQEAKKAGFAKKPAESDADFAARMRFMNHLREQHKHFKEESTFLKGKTAFSWQVKKHIMTAKQAAEQGILPGQLSYALDHLVFSLPVEDKGDLKEAEQIIEDKCYKEAAIKLFKHI